MTFPINFSSGVTPFLLAKKKRFERMVLLCCERSFFERSEK
jgi:hypothetical protein